MTNSPMDLSALALAAAIRQGRLSAREAVTAALARIERHNPTLNAFITVCPEQALAAAAAADARRASGARLGPLHGVPVAVKDLTDTAGIRTTYGSALFADHVPEQDDLVVTRLRAAGAIIVGKTNTPEFGFGAITDNALCGPTRNPLDHSLTSGGSSGGSAAAVAARLLPLAHGTDFGGSVRTPASFCGIVGLRPTVGRIPRVPKALAWESMNTHGVLARSVDDAALMLRAVAGPDPRDPLSQAPPFIEPTHAVKTGQQLRVAASVDLGIARIAADVIRAFDRVIERAAGIFPIVDAAHPDCAGAQACFETLRAAQLYQGLNQHLGHPRLTPTVCWNVERGETISAHVYLTAEADRSALYQRFLAFFQKYDVLLTPAAAVPPFANAQREVASIDGVATRNLIDYLTITYAITLSGCPALSLPLGVTQQGLPVGVQMVAAPFQEARLLAAARLLQRQLS